MTTIEVSFYRADLPAWLPARLRSGWSSRAVRSWGSLGFVKKVFSGVREAEILRAFYLAQSHLSPDRFIPVPRVLGLLPGPLPGTAYLEDLPEVGFKELAGKAEAEALALSIVSLQDYLQFAESCSGLLIPEHTVLGNLRRVQVLMRSADRAYLDIRSLMERVWFVRARLSDLPQVLSHNDIGYGNMSILRKSASRIEIRFIDFGSISRNVLGADLHHCADWSVKGGENSRFFDALALCYAHSVSQPVLSVRLGAYGYALERMVMRWWRVESLRGNQERARVFLQNVEELLRCAELQISTTDASTPLLCVDGVER